MSNKTTEKLSDIDRRLRKLFPTCTWDDNELVVKIELRGGFEYFNTRPYHNYETWSAGYFITTGERYGSIEVNAEDLDEAVARLEKEMNANYFATTKAREGN